MTYRESARTEAEGTSETDAALATFDASGARGGDGEDGAPGEDGSGSGADGQRGEDASSAQPGQDAGTVELRMAEGDAPGTVALVGRIGRADGTGKKIGRSVAFGDRGFVELVARGGDGGDGGDGGRGGDGATGSSGSNATRYSSGGDGGPGGDGGDGGNATSGAPGGAGGSITVTVREEDTHLLMLTRHRVRGGRGGKPGENGSGGEGGAGGSGGSSYSWTESESYTDSQGQSQSRTTHHSNSGGSSGRSGSSGDDGSAPVELGSSGPRGRLEIRVEGGAQAGVYTERYDLALVGFEHRSENDDGIYEPEEKVHVSKIAVENTGGMPTPAHREVRLSLVTHGWISADDRHLVLPRPLAPGERHVFEKEALDFTIGLYKPSAPSDPLSYEETIRHRASIPAVSRDFEDYQGEATAEDARFLIQFPIQVSAIETLHSLAPGEAARIRWTVENVSTKAFGSASELRRAVGVRLALHESELGAEALIFFDDQDRRVSLSDGFARALEQLGPAERREIQGTIAIPEGATCYREGRVRLAAELGFIREPARTRPIQYREFSIRVGQRYEAAPDAGLLLVVNNRTTAAELAAWRTLAACLGFELNVFDFSLHGGIDLSADADGAPSLLAQFAGKTVVVLDNVCDGPSGEGRPSAHLAKAQVFECAAAGTRLAFIGRCPDLDGLLVPTQPQDDEEPADALAEAAFLEALAERGAGDAEAGAVECTLAVRARAWWPWSQPGAASLATTALALQEALCDRHPTRRYVVIHELDRVVESKAAWITTYKLGELTVLRTLDAASPTIVSRKVEDASIHTPEYVLGSENVATLLSALGFSEKLLRLSDLLRAGAAPLLPGAAPSGEISVQPPTGPELTAMMVDAVLVDLANEQLGALRRGWGAVDASALPLLSELCKAPFDARLAEDPRSEPGSHLVSLIARLRFFASSQIRAWEWVPPLLWLRRAPRLSRLTAEILDGLVERLALEDAIDAELAALGRRYRQALRDHEVVGGKRGWARALLRGPIERGAIRTDADALGESADRVLTAEAYEELRARDAKRAKRRRRLAKAADQARKALLRAETTKELVAKQG